MRSIWEKNDPGILQFGWGISKEAGYRFTIYFLLGWCIWVLEIGPGDGYDYV